MYIFSSRRISLFIMIYCALQASASAQLALPKQQLEQIDAQQQQRAQQYQRQQAAKQSAEVHFSPPKNTALALPQEKPCFPIQHIAIRDYDKPEGKSLFDWAYQQAAQQLALQLPHCFGAEGINVLMKQMQNIIISKGYITTRVVAEPQDLSKGQLKLLLIAGRVGKIRVDEQSPMRRFTPLTSWFAISAQTGDLLNIRDIEQSLENLKRVPTVNALINLAPSQDPQQIDQSDLLVQYQQQFPFRLSLSLDDAGSKSTGRWQGSAAISIDNPFSANDLLYAGFTHSLKRPTWSGQDDKGRRQSKNWHFSYSIPYGYWLLSFQHNQHQYHQEVAAAYGSTLLYSGKSENNQLRLSRVMYRDHQHKTSIFAAVWNRKSHNFINDQEVEIQRKRTAGWELGFSHKAYFRAASLQVGASFKRGTGMNRAQPYPEEKSNEGSSRMKIIQAYIDFSKPFSLFNQQFIFRSHWNAQWNKTPLILQDQFSIGGRYSVRGTDGELSLSGERGWLWRNELAWQLGNSEQQLYVTLDKGKVSGRDTQQLLGTSLVGATLGLRGGWQWFSYEVFVGKPIHVPAGFRTSKQVIGFNLSASF